MGVVWEVIVLDLLRGTAHTLFGVAKEALAQSKAMHGADLIVHFGPSSSIH